MSEFTTSISTILRMKQQELRKQGETVDFDTMEGIRALARAAFFSKDGTTEGPYRSEIELIDPEYREYFCTAFPLHYINDEIGMDTVPAWKIQLMAKIVENADYMNTIFESLRKQNLRGYKITKRDNTLAASKISALQEDTNRENIGNSVVNRDDWQSGHGVDEGRSSNDSSETNNDSVSNLSAVNVYDNESSVNAEKSNSSTFNNELDSTVASGSKRDVSSEATNSDTENNNSHTQNGTYSDTETNSSQKVSNSVNKSNSVAGMLDTPQGAISNMRQPDTDVSGMGVSAVQNAQYNYLTSASTADATSVGDSMDNNSGQVTKIHHGNGFEEGDKGDTITATNSMSNSNSEDENESISNKNGSVVSDDEKVSEAQNARQSSTVDEKSQMSSGKKVGNSNETHRNETTDFHEGNDNTYSSDANYGKDERVSNSADVSSEAGNMNEDSYDYSLEMLALAEPFMIKIWRLFDPIMFQIIDVF